MSYSLINVDGGNTMNNNMNNNGSSSIGDVSKSSSIGSLLTEEWMIQPFSTIPSFIEMTFIQDASSSFQSTTIKTMIHMIHYYIQNQIRQNIIYNQSNWNNDIDNEQQSTLLQTLYNRIKNRIQNVRIQCYKLFDLMLHQYNIEVRYILLFWIELICLHSSESARLREIIYSCRRVKMQPTKTLLSSNATTDSEDMKGNYANIQYKLVPLNNTDKILLTVLVTFGPYVREKLQQLYERFKNRDISNGNRILQHHSWKQTLLNRFIRYYVCLFPIGNSTVELYAIWCRWKYLKGLSLTYDIPSQLLSHLVRRVTQDDKNISSSHQQSDTKPNTTNDNNFTDEKTISNNSSSSAVMSTWQKPMINMVSTFTILNWITKLRLEWLEYSQQQRNHDQNAISDKRKLIPPPPQRFTGMSNTNSTVQQNVCPLCFRSRIHPTASTSGYVFCLKCIRDYVKEHNTCPVTAIPCPESKLVRLYEPLKSNSLNN